PIKQRMAQLRKQGYQFWLDDVGCGFFDLALIDEVKPEVVKLCIKIISRLTFDPTLVDEIKAVVKAVHAYGGAVLAEGIEEQVQLDMAEQLNIDLAQGYLFDKPQPLV
ncbi:EAL domain-containing protein, partial [Vibrio fortis]